MVKSALGIIALVLAVAALGMAVLPKHIVSMQNERMTVGERVQDVAGQITDRLEGKASADPVRMWTNIAVVTGLLGIVLGVVGFVRKEDGRLCGAAIIVAAVAIVWPYVVKALG